MVGREVQDLPEKLLSTGGQEDFGLVVVLDVGSDGDIKAFDSGAVGNTTPLEHTLARVMKRKQCSTYHIFHKVK